MKKLVWVIGNSGSGKTTIAEYLGKNYGCKILFPGKECRKKFGSGFMAKTDNPTAPTETNTFVSNLVIDAIEKLPDERTLIIDGFPRSRDQIDTVIINCLTTKIIYDVVYLFIGCDKRERLRRLSVRDTKMGDSLLTKRKISDEDSVMCSLLEYIFLNTGVFINTRVRVEHIDTTEIELNSSEYKNSMYSLYHRIQTGVIDSVSGMLALNNNFSNITFRNAGMPLTMEDLYSQSSTKDVMSPMEDSMVWTRRFVLRAIEELYELLKEIPESWWSKDKANVRKARVELIDAWHFILSAMYALGMNGTQFTTTYTAKREVNVNRQIAGYTKLKKVKGDDNHVGKQATSET